MRRPAVSLRATALFSAAALSLDELRNMLIWGPRAGVALARQGDGYLATLTPLVAALLAITLAQFMARLAGTRRDDRADAGGPVHVWLSTSAALLAVYVSQETLEALLASGHPLGPMGLFGHGGFVTVPLALALGGLVALALRGASAALAQPIAGLSATDRILPARATVVLRPACLLLAPLDGPLALNLASRAPPQTLR